MPHLTSAAIPFISVAKETFAVGLFFAFLAGMTSTLGALIAGTNSQARLIFNAGREGLIPSFIGRVALDASHAGVRALYVPRTEPRDHRRVGDWAHDWGPRRVGGDEPAHDVRRVLDVRHDPDPHRVRTEQRRAAVLLSEELHPELFNVRFVMAFSRRLASCGSWCRSTTSPSRANRLRSTGIRTWR